MIVVEEYGLGRTGGIRKAIFRGFLFEGKIMLVYEEQVLTVAGGVPAGHADIDVGPAIVVDVDDGDAGAPPGSRNMSSCRDVFEAAITFVEIQT